MPNDATVASTNADVDAEAALRALGATLIWHTEPRRMADGTTSLEIAPVESGCYTISDVPYSSGKASFFCRYLPRQFGVTYYANPAPGERLVRYNYRQGPYRCIPDARAGCEHHYLMGDWSFRPPPRPKSPSRLLAQSSICGVLGVLCMWAVVRGPRGQNFVSTALLSVSSFLIPAAYYQLKEALLFIRKARKQPT